MEGSLGRRTTSGKSDVAEADNGRNYLQEAKCGGRSELDSGECTPENVDSLVKVLGIRDTCRHPGEGSNFDHYSTKLVGDY